MGSRSIFDLPVGARVTKRYNLPATPSARLLESKDVPDEVFLRMREKGYDSDHIDEVVYGIPRRVTK